MSAYYIYFISSLPMLHFGKTPPFSFDKFIQMCAEFMPGSDLAFLQAVSLKQESYHQIQQATLRKWHDLNFALQNELVKLRSVRKRIDPAKYLRQDGHLVDANLVHVAMNAYKATSLLEAEKILDQARWQMLEELSAGHYFDIDTLIIYGLKLSLLERWQIINSADKVKLLADTLVKVNQTETKN
jgi:hypothetical protein